VADSLNVELREERSYAASPLREIWPFGSYPREAYLCYTQCWYENWGYVMNRSELPADLEEFVQRELAEGKYRSEAELVADALRLLRERHQSREDYPESVTRHVPIWELFQETLKDIPEEELDHLPPDAAEQHDHYIYGTPKKPA
jgi:Arc/MetJ-type ribon-helix-helix transcriptional regulator